MELETLQKYYNRCNPEEALDPDDERNVDVDSLGSPDERARGENWVSRLARQIELSGGYPVIKYLTGLRGSGKSTELRRLAVRLRDTQRANLLPVLVDAEATLDLTAEIDVPDIMAAILYETERHVLEAEGKDAEDALKEGFGTRFWVWLAHTDIELGKIEAGIQGKVVSGKLVAEMKTRPTLRKRIRDTVSANLTSFLREVREELERLNQRAREAGHAGIIVIFDSLEKLQGTSTSWERVLDSAERVFASDAPYLKLPVHVLYTIPPALALRLKVDVHFLPMIKLQDRSGNPFAIGMDAARRIVRKRVPNKVLRQILGPTSFEHRIQRLIEWSGGYPREIIRLLQAVLEVEVEEETISEASFKRLLSRAGDEYRRVVLASGAIEWLSTVAVNRSLVLETDAHREAADRMLSNNIVLRYLNDEEWFDLHPAVRGIAEVQRGIQQLTAGRGSSGSSSSTTATVPSDIGQFTAGGGSDGT